MLGGAAMSVARVFPRVFLCFKMCSVRNFHGRSKTIPAQNFGFRVTLLPLNGAGNASCLKILRNKEPMPQWITIDAHVAFVLST